MREIKRVSFRTVRNAVMFFVDVQGQGYSPSLIKVSEGWEVSVWG